MASPGDAGALQCFAAGQSVFRLWVAWCFAAAERLVADATCDGKRRRTAERDSRHEALVNVVEFSSWS